MRVLHSFRKSLALSQSLESAEWWAEIYQQAFPTFECMYAVKDLRSQKRGIDRILTLASGRKIRIEEKVRHTDYGDVALEMWAVLSNEKGWIAKDLYCDYLAYVCIPRHDCLMLPFHLLRRAWQLNRYQWFSDAEKRLNGFCIVDAPNDGYITRSVCVPRTTLLAAIADVTTVRWQSETPRAEPGQSGVC